MMSEDTIPFTDEILLDENLKTILFNEKKITLTTPEFTIFSFIKESTPQFSTSTQLAEQYYGKYWNLDHLSSVSRFIKHIREKLLGSGLAIKYKPRRGYYLAMEIHHE